MHALVVRRSLWCRVRGEVEEYVVAAVEIVDCCESDYECEEGKGGTADYGRHYEEVVKTAGG